MIMAPPHPPADVCGSRACPACNATGTDWDGSAPCRACLGTLWFPYPWNLPEDGTKLPPLPWTQEESAIVCGAPTHYLAYAGYCAVYGPVRTYRSVALHRYYRLTHPEWRPLWTEAEESAIETAENPAEAVRLYRAAFPEADLSDAAIERKWRRMGGEKREPS